MRREGSHEEHPQVRKGQKGGACIGDQSQEEGEESENHCVPEAKERKKWSDVSNAEDKSIE